MGMEPAFWSMARALAEVLPEGDKERTMLLGLAGTGRPVPGGRKVDSPSRN